ncbi:MAG: threonine ammonia-lyase [Candidatus Lokiarchaeota archaeon]|nr:threonine ammonia-lyase [Candidatus Lokiarchaeota archaeon]MBD3340108.1 threonine ammonia-lyase [Candidatus Lokiarchaeota archaeon]
MTKINHHNEYISEIKQIRKSFGEFVRKTPLELNNTFSRMTGNNIYLKLENFQRTGSFKIRGAYNKISKLSREQKKLGVITASAGNHGQAVALAANTFDIPSTVVVPEGAPIVKIEAIKNYNDQGEIIEYGRTYDDAYQRAFEIREKKNLTFIHAYNDLDIINGQATIGLEMMNQYPDLEYIFCPIGGGGLISGISSYCKTINENIKIIGVQSKNATSMYESHKRGELTLIELKDTICDGIAVKKPGDITFELIRKYVDDIILVSDEEVANSILLLLERAKTYVEGAGAAALAAVISNKLPLKNKSVGVIISGGNLTPNLLNRILIKGLIKEGRLVKFKTMIPDIPGTLIKVLDIIAQEKGNIVSIQHERERLELEYKMTEVIIEIETRNHEHINQIMNSLKHHFEIEILKF